MADTSSITLKYGPEYDATWYVVSGDPASIKEQLAGFYGLTDTDDLSVHEVLLQVKDIINAVGAVTSQLNGSIASKDWPSSSDKPASKSKWSGAKKSEPKEEKKDEHPFGQILAQIEVASSEDALKKLFALNKEAFTDDDVKAVSKKKFDELKGI